MASILSFPKTFSYTSKMPEKHEAEVIYLKEWLSNPPPKTTPPSTDEEEPYSPLRKTPSEIDDYGEEDEDEEYDDAPYDSEDSKASYLNHFIVF